jgi:Kelch motif protein
MMMVCASGEREAVDWVKVSDDTGWQARDSQGEVVHDGKMWILGGWFSSHKPCPRDVWSSSDGTTWELVQETAPWRHGDLPMTLAFKGKMWFMGGWCNGRLPGHSASNQVWSSTDGAAWELATPRAGWSPRLAAGVVVFKDRMWMLGGIENYFFGDDADLTNDVWCSRDGKQWEQVTARAGWSPRAYHQAVVLDGKMWVMGGGNYVPKHHALNDVWCSEDGVTWTQVTEAAPWGPRLWFSSVVYRDRMWVLGGWSQKTDNYGDVWHSADGKNWTQFQSDVVWRPRHEHSAFVFQDKIWVAGGHARPLDSEVWSLEIPKEGFGKP